MPAMLYDWDAWFSKGKFTLRRGKEYACGNASICQQCRNAAAERGLRVTIEEGESSINVSLVTTPGRRGGRRPRPPEEPPKAAKPRKVKNGN